MSSAGPLCEPNRGQEGVRRGCGGGVGRVGEHAGRGGMPLASTVGAPTEEYPAISVCASPFCANDSRKHAQTIRTNTMTKWVKLQQAKGFSTASVVM
eukprot:975532-Pyramimonas_sp.AAC.1